MSWFVVDDQAFTHPKHQTLVRAALQGDTLAMAAGYLWTLVGSRLRASGKDGVLDRLDLFGVYPDPRVEEMAARLVDAGLWHTDATCCERCDPPGPGRWCFHDWGQWSIRTAEEDRLRRALQVERKDSSLHERLWERDRLPVDHPGQADHAVCVYCGTVVWRDQRKGDRAPEMDHVFGRPIGLDGVAIACRACNRSKGNRSASKAGMTFHPTRPHAEALRRRQHRSHPEGFADLLELAWVAPGDGSAVAADQRRSHPDPGRAEPLAGGGGSSLPAARPDGPQEHAQEQAQEPHDAHETAPVCPGAARLPQAAERAAGGLEGGVGQAASQPDGGLAPLHGQAGDGLEPAGEDQPSRTRARTGPCAGARTAAPALSRPAGQGKAGQGQGKAGQGTGRQGSGDQPGQGEGRRRGRRRGRRSRRKPVVCQVHGDRFPCRGCEAETEVDW